LRKICKFEYFLVFLHAILEYSHMKRLFILLLLSPSLLFAKPIDPETALQIATNFVNAPKVDSTGNLRKAIKSKKLVKVSREISHDQQFFIYQGNDGEGFVIIAADDVAHPILGYSETGTLDIDNMPINMRAWLNNYSQQIKWAQDNDIEQDDSISTEWERLYSSNKITSSTIVGPLITTTWDQSPYYNQLCPKNQAGEQALTGCPATAMAQVMKFWEWPKQGRGMHSYNSQSFGTLSANFGATTYQWDNMPTKLFSYSSTRTPIDQSTSAQKEAVAQLMYHCGVSINMNYGINGSGIGLDSMHLIANALKTYFLYDSAAHAIKQEDYTETGWMNTFKKELNEGRPIVHAGTGSKGGHCFVCDGYNSDNQFHINWGWTGIDNGWFALNALYVRNDITKLWQKKWDYSQKQRAVIGIHPINSEEFPAYNIQAASNWTLSSDSIRYGGNLTAQIKIKNAGTEKFTGRIVAVVLDKNYNYFTDYTLNSSVQLNPNATMTFNPSISANASFVPGTYYVSLFFEQGNTGLQIVNSTSQYVNVCRFKVYYNADLETASNFNVVSTFDNELVTGQSATISVGVRNKGTSAYYGELAMVFFDPNDLSVGQDFDVLSLTLAGIGVNKYYNCTFNGTVNLSPGTYLATLMYKPTSGTYNFAGSTDFSNPVYINILAEPLRPDKYEVNDTITTASLLSPQFNQGKATINLDSLTIHNGTDIDFFKIPLNASKQYTCLVQLDNEGLENAVEINSTIILNDSIYLAVSPNETITLPNASQIIVENTPSLPGNTGYYNFAIELTEISSDLKAGKYIVLVNREVGNKNWFYMTSGLGTASTKRLQAVNTNEKIIDSVAITNLPDSMVWDLVKDGDNWKLKNGDKYVNWTSGNSATLDAVGKSLTFSISKNVVKAHFSDGTDERYLSMNGTAGNDYLAFYKESVTNTIKDLYFLPYQEKKPEKEYVIVAHRSDKSNWFYLTAEKDGTKDRMKAVDAGTSSILGLNTSTLEDKYYWTIQEQNEGVYLKSKTDKYIAWNSGNTALLSATAYLVSQSASTTKSYTWFTVEDMSDASNPKSRYLALNSTDGNNYFAFYSGQTKDLLLVEKGGSIPTIIDEIQIYNKTTQKIYDGSRILIVKDGEIFDLLGNRIH